jgi:DNA-binding response OmpR family regulator
MKEKILIVDDNEIFRTIMEIFLSKNFEVMTSGDGLEALKLLQFDFFPDLIISDLIMPVMDGKTMINLIKKDFSVKDIPVIILSSSSDLDVRNDLINAGAADYIVKPFRLLELSSRIEILLKNVTTAKIR